MKKETLRVLMMAKVFRSKAHKECLSADHFIANSGLIVLQDFVELTLHAILIETNYGNQNKSDFLPFDKLIKAVESMNYTVPYSSQLKTMQTLRNLVKHNGVLSDLTEVANAFGKAIQAMDALVSNVFEATFDVITLTFLLSDGESKGLLQSAESSLLSRDYINCLGYIRKAIYLEIEIDYMIKEWENTPGMNRLGLLSSPFGGRKAHVGHRNQEWICSHVKNPFDYIQLEHAVIDSELAMWGVNPQTFWNIWRLTPDVIRYTSNDEWKVKSMSPYTDQLVIEENAVYCLEEATNIILKKYEFKGSAKWLNPLDKEPVSYTHLTLPTTPYV